MGGRCEGKAEKDCKARLGTGRSTEGGGDPGESRQPGVERGVGRGCIRQTPEAGDKGSTVGMGTRTSVIV